MVAGQASSGGNARSSAASIRARRSSSAPARPCARAPALRLAAILGGEGLGAGLAPGVQRRLTARVLHQELDLAFRLLELGVAEAGEPDALFVELQRLLERQLPLLEALDDLLELLERALER